MCWRLVTRTRVWRSSSQQSKTTEGRLQFARRTSSSHEDEGEKQGKRQTTQNRHPPRLSQDVFCFPKVHGSYLSFRRGYLWGADKCRPCLVSVSWVMAEILTVPSVGPAAVEFWLKRNYR